MPSHPDRVRRNYRERLVMSVAEVREREALLPYDETDDARVQSAIDDNRLAWGVTANVIEGDDFWGV